MLDEECTVLVTGAAGTVARATIDRLVADGHRVVGLMRDSAANRRAAEAMPAGVRIAWCDLLDTPRLDAVIAEHRPDATIHAAAVIPPQAWITPENAWRVNLDSTRTLIEALERHVPGARLVHVSSMGVHGSVNPHTAGVLHADSPLRPADCYGASKAAAEEVVRASSLDWGILRVGAVIFPEVLTTSGNLMPKVFMDAVVPIDGQVHAIDIRDLAVAVANAVTADITGRTLLLAGDESCRRTHGEVAGAMLNTFGIGPVPRWLPARLRRREGDPGDDDAWFSIGWMDATEAQKILEFQTQSWDDILAHMRASQPRWLRLLRPLARLFGPLVHIGMALLSPDLRRPAGPAAPWQLVRERYGDAAVATTREP